MPKVVSNEKIQKLALTGKPDKLIRALRSDLDRESIEKISTVLIGLGKPVIKPLLDACRKRKLSGLWVIPVCSRILAEIYLNSRDEEIFCGLIEALRLTSEGLISDVSAEALGRTGDTRAEEPLLAELARWIEKKYSLFPNNIVRGLGLLKSEKAIPRLMELLVVKGDYEDYVQNDVVDALISIGAPSIPFLLAGARNDWPSYRYACLNALKNLKHKMTESQRGEFELFQASNKVNVMRGGFSEPYCSERCYKQGAVCIMSVAAEKPPARCGFCGKSLKSSEYALDTFGFIPFERKTLFICSACANRAANQLSHYKQCVVCQRKI